MPRVQANQTGQVSKHLNSYFGQLIDTVRKHGGDMLKTAGDALICMFGDQRKVWLQEGHAKLSDFCPLILSIVVGDDAERI